MSTIKYKQKREFKSEIAAASGLPVLPELRTDTPPADVYLYRWFDNNGNYIGWTDFDTSRKFLYGKLYYKTKGAYRVKSRRLSYDDRATRKLYIYEKSSNHLAAYAIYRKLNAKDFVDTSDRRALAVISIESFKSQSLTAWNVTDYSDPYNFVPKEMRVKFRNELSKFVEDKRNELIAYCQSEIDATDALKAASVEAGVNLDI